MKKVMKRFTVYLVLVVMISLIIVPSQAIKVYDNSIYDGGGKAPPAFSERKDVWLDRQKTALESLPAQAAYFALSVPTSLADVVIDVVKAGLEEYLKSQNVW